MYNPIELHSLEQIEAMDKQREKGIESLEISSDGNYVKCQGCGKLWPIIKDASRLTNSRNSGRIYQLQTRIKRSTRANNCKKEQEELNQLLEEEKQKDILRRLPLYSSKITGYRFFCSECGLRVISLFDISLSHNLVFIPSFSCFLICSLKARNALNI